MKIVHIKSNLLSANTYNPNVVEEGIMEQLKKDITRVGIKQPIIVRKDQDHDDLYIIIDGEHRWITAQELGIKKVPCEILDIDENEAKIMTITMNRLRGEFDSIKLAEVINSLKEVYSSEDLEERLGYNAEQLQSYGDLLEFDFEKLSEHDADITAAISNIDHNEGLLNELNLSLTLEQLEIIEGAIGVVGPKSAITKEEALESICKEYLQNNQPQILKDIQERQKQLDSLAKEEESRGSDKAQE